MALLGNGLAPALSPYLAVTLREADPRIPFVLASLGVVVASLGMQWAERRLVAGPARSEVEPPRGRSIPTGSLLVAAGLLAIGFQIHFPVNAAPAYLHVARLGQLEILMSAFLTALSLGRTGREGLLTGALYSVLAIGAMLRIGGTALHLDQAPAVKTVLPFLPTGVWLAAGVLLMLAARGDRRVSPTGKG